MRQTLVLFSMYAAVAASTPALAHVTLEQHEATIGGPAKLVFRVPHGCDDEPTMKLRVTLPEGFIAAKPMPKPGWTLDLVEGRYAQSHGYFSGRQLAEGVTTISWSGQLPSAYYDEFVIAGFVSSELKPQQTLYFPVVQECRTKTHHWIEIPKPGETDELKEPAPSLKLIPKK